MASFPHRELTGCIIGACVEVHRALGPGLLESVYLACLHEELGRRGLWSVKEARLPVFYKGRRLDAEYRIDLVVEHKVLVELKSVEQVVSVHQAQLLTYLRLSGKQIGLLVNFNVAKLVDGVQRVIN